MNLSYSPWKIKFSSSSSTSLSLFTYSVVYRGLVLQGSRRDQKIKRSYRREVQLDPHFCPEEIMSGEVELG